MKQRAIGEDGGNGFVDKYCLGAAIVIPAIELGPVLPANKACNSGHHIHSLMIASFFIVIDAGGVISTSPSGILDRPPRPCREALVLS